MAQFHFVEDYELHVKQLIKNHGLDEAMSLAVGGGWLEFGEKLSKFVQSLGVGSGMSVLDFGCGSGRLAHHLSKDLENLDYLGIDVVDELLDYAKIKCPKNYTFLKNHTLSIPAKKATFDFAFGFSIFTHLLQTEIKIYSDGILKALKPGGIFVYSFLEFDNHYAVFENSVGAHVAHNKPYPVLNTFLDRNQVLTLAEKSGFEFVKFIEPNDGIGQTVVILNKPKSKNWLRSLLTSE